MPGLMVWPDKVKRPITITAPCVTSDYFPTILDVLGIDLPADREYDGVSMLDLMEGKTETRKRSIGFLNKDAKEAVWMGQRYKLISTTKGEKLYDIIKDPSETEDIIESTPKVAQQMKRELVVWKTSVLEELQQVP